EGAVGRTCLAAREQGEGSDEAYADHPGPERSEGGTLARKEATNWPEQGLSRVPPRSGAVNACAASRQRRVMASRSSPESPPTLQRAALAPGADVRVWIDGAEVKPAEARVSVFDRGFLYGDSVFETLRTYGGRAFALEEHLERLARSAALVHLRLPVSLDVLRAEIEGARESVRPDRAHDQESYLRLTVTRGSGPPGLDPSNATEPLRVLIVAPLHAPPAV